MEILERLRETSLFAALRDDERAMAELRKAVTLRHVEQGGYILREGDVGEEMYILLDGRATVEKRTLHEDQYVVAELSSDTAAFFGELALIDRDLRSASIRAETRCSVIALSKEQFDRIGEDYPLLGYEVTRVIARRLAGMLRKANQDTVTLFEALLEEVTK